MIQGVVSARLEAGTRIQGLLNGPQKWIIGRNLRCAWTSVRGVSLV